MPRLSTRLQFFLENLCHGEDVWDLCCDHGLLGEAALAEGRFGRVHFVDQVPHIISKLSERLGDLDGATILCHDAGALEQELTGSVVIAGVGSDRILEILQRLIAKDRLQASRLVLSPHRSEQKFLAGLRELLGDRWIVRQTTHVPEGPRQRFVVLVEPLRGLV